MARWANEPRYRSMRKQQSINHLIVLCTVLIVTLLVHSGHRWSSRNVSTSWHSRRARHLEPRRYLRNSDRSNRRGGVSIGQGTSGNHGSASVTASANSPGSITVGSSRGSGRSTGRGGGSASDEHGNTADTAGSSISMSTASTNLGLIGAGIGTTGVSTSLNSRGRGESNFRGSGRNTDSADNAEEEDEKKDNKNDQKATKNDDDDGYAFGQGTSYVEGTADGDGYASVTGDTAYAGMDGCRFEPEPVLKRHHLIIHSLYD